MRKLVFAITIALPATALAGGYIIPNENARDLALSSSATADQTGPEALFLNTAALAGPDGLAISASGEILNNRTTWSDPSLGDASLIPQYNTPVSGAVSFGSHVSRDMAWGIGVGADVPAGGSLVWPNGWQGQEAIQTVDQRVYRIGAGAAFQPVRYLKVGVSYLRYQATEELHQSLNFLDHQGDGGIGLSGGANSFGVAVEIRTPQIPLSIGVNYSHSGDLSLSGNAHFTGVPASFMPLIHDQAVTEALKVPNVLVVGAAYAIERNITVMGAYTWERWNAYTEDKFVGTDGFTVSVPRNYRNAHVYRVGVEWRLAALPQLTVRGGGLRSVSSQPTDTVSPSLTDGNSWAFSFGAGVNIQRALRIDFGYQHAMFDDVTATGTEAFPGTYRTHVDLFSLGANWRTNLGSGR
ncbi:MAG: rane protein involved in aromatic hydrocarbon degradation [Myxococcales bacterium]|nr:rane protein involved in aromatic hydrocarbon degradation [Myxococcales bacterium]